MDLADRRDHLGVRGRVHLIGGAAMLTRLLGAVLGVATMFVWGTANAASRPPLHVPAWGFGAMVGVLVLALVRHSMSVRSTGGPDSLAVGRLAASTLLSVVLAGLTLGVAVVVERALAAGSTAWTETLLRACFHALAVLTIGLCVSPTKPERTPQNDGAE
jgi:hypothetical protein